MPLINSHFKPAWWLPGPHLQTIWPILSRRRFKLDLTWESMCLSDGDYIDLVWSNNDQNNRRQPIILLLHGLTGSIESPQLQGLLTAFARRGWRAVLMHFRGSGGKPNHFLHSYHAGKTDDLDFVIEQLHRREPDVRIAVIGISLGGNVLLKWLGETGRDDRVDAAAAISVPFELDKAAIRLQFGLSRVYQWWLIKQLKKESLAKFENLNFDLKKHYLSSLRTFCQFDEKITAPLHGFQSAYDYYKRCSSRPYLKRIQIPTLLIQAINDPFISTDALPRADELSPKVEIELTKSGGHVGFIAGAFPSRAHYWLEERLINYLTAYI